MVENDKTYSLGDSVAFLQLISALMVFLHMIHKIVRITKLPVSWYQQREGALPQQHRTLCCNVKCMATRFLMKLLCRGNISNRVVIHFGMQFAMRCCSGNPRPLGAINLETVLSLLLAVAAHVTFQI